MQRIFQSTLSQINFWLLRPRCLSQLAHNHTQNTLEEEDDFLVPKIPHFDYIPPLYTDPFASEMLEKRKEYLSPSILHLYKNPLNYLVDRKMQYLYDENGRRYLDAFVGIATVCCRHCHPNVVEAIVNQTRHLQHSTVLYVHHAIADFVEALAAKLPGDLKPLQTLEFG